MHTILFQGKKEGNTGEHWQKQEKKEVVFPLSCFIRQKPFSNNVTWVAAASYWKMLKSKMSDIWYRPMHLVFYVFQIPKKSSEDNF